MGHNSIRLSGNEKRAIKANFLYGQVKPKTLIKILEEINNPLVKRSAKKLIELIVNGKYSTLEAHTVGSIDKNMHYTIRISGRGGFHLQIDAKKQIWRITNSTGNPISGDQQPWSPPGALPSKK